MAKHHLPEHFKPWIEARNRFHLSHAQVQMARELGMNPKKLGKLNNHHQEPWKLPLDQFIEHLYRKRFNREQPAVVMSIEDMVKKDSQRKEARKARRMSERTFDAAARSQFVAEARNAAPGRAES